MKSYAKLVLMVAFAVLFVSTFAAADTPGAHPAYLHALTDLRGARSLLAVETGSYRLNANEKYAIEGIDAAMQVLRDAAINDGKSLSDHPPLDSGWSRTDRLHRAYDLLASAARDIDQRESDNFANGLKHRALHHIGDAMKAVQAAIDGAGR